MIRTHLSARASSPENLEQHVRHVLAGVALAVLELRGPACRPPDSLDALRAALARGAAVEDVLAVGLVAALPAFEPSAR